MSNVPIKVTYTDLADLKGQVLNLASAFDNADGASITPTRTATTAGVGQFLSQLGDALDQFTASWRLWLDTAGDDASILGSSIGQAAIDFSALDAAGSDLTVTLS